jgi:hypothetical protein
MFNINTKASVLWHTWHAFWGTNGGDKTICRRWSSGGGTHASPTSLSLWFFMQKMWLILARLRSTSPLILLETSDRTLVVNEIWNNIWLIVDLKTMYSFSYKNRNFIDVKQTIHHCLHETMIKRIKMWFLSWYIKKLSNAFVCFYGFYFVFKRYLYHFF